MEIKKNIDVQQTRFLKTRDTTKKKLFKNPLEKHLKTKKRIKEKVNK